MHKLELRRVWTGFKCFSGRVVSRLTDSTHSFYMGDGRQGVDAATLQRTACYTALMC